MADRCFCPAPPVEGRLVLEGDEARHLSRVRRIGVGEVVEVFDGKGFGSRARVDHAGKDRVDLTLLAEPIADRVAPCRLTLATAVPKGDRFDWLIEKATELGVTRLVPLITERSVVDPRGAKLDRLPPPHRRGRQAMRQEPAHGAGFPDPLGVPGACPAERRGSPIRGACASAWPPIHTGPGHAGIGPEGGFTEPEVALAVERDGRRRPGGDPARIETAGWPARPRSSPSAAHRAMRGAIERPSIRSIDPPELS
jgi:16S rRNA (uracil1498-N3)-methyltransferase